MLKKSKLEGGKMIKKITNINLGIFKNFQWGSLGDFQKLNIIYGRNYSGKTTLSRIFRALEAKEIHNRDKYDNPSFEIVLDNKTITQDELEKFNTPVCVFNEDFVRENLSFLRNENDTIKAFVLGKENKDIQSQIDNKKKELGENKAGEETGLYKTQQENLTKYEIAKKEYEEKVKELDDLLSQKATKDRKIAIKYNSLLEVPTYDINDIKNDIDKIKQIDYIKPTDGEKEKSKKLLSESKKNDVLNISFDFCFTELINESKELIERKIVKTENIEELVNDDLINWAKRGKELLKPQDKCAFCGNAISNERWAKLTNYFNDAQKKLEGEIIKKLRVVEEFQRKLKELNIDKNLFYSNFHDDLEKLNLNELKQRAESSLESLREQLTTRQNAIFENKEFVFVEDLTDDLKNFSNTYEKIVTWNNKLTLELEEEQKNAREHLRLVDVSEYLQSIGYDEKLSEIEKLNKAKEEAFEIKGTTDKTIAKKESAIKELEAEMKSVENASKKINEYLKAILGDEHLSISPIKENQNIHEEKVYKFEIVRDGKKAFNLSEGEANLVAFSYFLAKLDEVDGGNPIIWIDDPISSLDSNHIFGVYSLIMEKTTQYDFGQIFISTHNLNFLKYLKRISLEKGSKAYFIIRRQDRKSYLEKMPEYMKEYVTEFNYLFKQIYECSKISKIDDSNYTVLYNFSNNARKFLEIYLYYQYPDGHKDKNDKDYGKGRKEFFGEGIEPIYTNRLLNEYSHLCGTFERGEEPIDIPEAIKVAQVIIEKIKSRQGSQYEALLRSIQVDPNSTNATP